MPLVFLTQLPLPGPHVTPAPGLQSGLVKLYEFLPPTLDLTCTLISGKLITGLQGSWLRAGLRSVLAGRVWCPEQDRQVPMDTGSSGAGWGRVERWAKQTHSPWTGVRGAGREENVRKVGESYCPQPLQQEGFTQINKPGSSRAGTRTGLGSTCHQEFHPLQ